MNKQIEKLLFQDIRLLIEQSRQQLAVVVNSALSLLYWQIGKRIKENILNNQRAEYGEQIIKTLADQLTAEYGRGWSEKQLRHCLHMVETFPDFLIISTLSRQLSYIHRYSATPNPATGAALLTKSKFFSKKNRMVNSGPEC